MTNYAFVPDLTKEQGEALYRVVSSMVDARLNILQKSDYEDQHDNLVLYERLSKVGLLLSILLPRLYHLHHTGGIDIDRSTCDDLDELASHVRGKMECLKETILQSK